MKKILLILAILPILSYADLSIIPVVGVERVQKFEPKQHTVNRLYYGVRMLYGKPHMALEAELTQAKDDETVDGFRVQEDATSAQLGIRSTLGQGPMNFYFRLGGSARKREVTTTEIASGNKETVEPAIVVNPYAGTGLILHFSKIMSINAGITAIFAGSPRGSDIDYQANLGYTIRFSSGR